MSGSTGVLGPDEFRRVADGALSVRGADDIEVLLMHEWGGLTRFANSEIHQSIAREDTGLRVRVVKGGHIGVAASNEATPEGAAATRTTSTADGVTAELAGKAASVRVLQPDTGLPVQCDAALVTTPSGTAAGTCTAGALTVPAGAAEVVRVGAGDPSRFE